MTVLTEQALDVLRAYSKGLITWRGASAKLMLDKFEQLEAMMAQAELPMHQPDEAREAQALGTLQSLIVSEIRKADFNE